MLLDGYDVPPLHHAAVLIEGNKIVLVGRAGEIVIPPDAEVIDTSGRVMLPGLIDLHVHLNILGHGDYDRWDPWIAKNNLVERVMEISARQLLMAGVTSAVDLGGTLKESLSVRDRIKKGTIPGPRMWMSGPWITRDRDIEGRAGRSIPPRKPRGQPRNWRRRVSTSSRPTSSSVRRTTRLVADAAHRHRLKVHAHVYDPRNVRDAFEAGIDVLTHVGSGGMRPTTPSSSWRS